MLQVAYIVLFGQFLVDFLHVAHLLDVLGSVHVGLLCQLECEKRKSVNS